MGTVTDIDLLKSLVNGLDGGDESVKKCVKVKEENAAYDDEYYYEYDYYDYYDPYDYLEELGRQQRRLKREAGKEGKGKSKKKRGKKSGKSKGNNKKGNKKGKNDRKYVNKPNKDLSPENTAKITAKLAKLGFTKLPTKSTMDELNCMWEELEDLLSKCGSKIVA